MEFNDDDDDDDDRMTKSFENDDDDPRIIGWPSSLVNQEKGGGWLSGKLCHQRAERLMMITSMKKYDHDHDDHDDDNFCLTFIVACGQEDNGASH